MLIVEDFDGVNIVFGEKVYVYWICYFLMLILIFDEIECCVIRFM